MQKQYALSAIRKNGLLVYKNDKRKDTIIKKRDDFPSAIAFNNAVISFPSKYKAEDFIKENRLVSLEVIEFEPVI